MSPAWERLTGRSLIAGSPAGGDSGAFCAFDPFSGEPMEPNYCQATPEQVEQAVQAAQAAAPTLARTSGAERARFLRAIADALDADCAVLVERAHLETALPKARLTCEVARASGQMRLFASVLEEGSWVQARIDTASPAGEPVSRPDVRSMLRPLGGPVVVFGASNFPLVFSVAGGDVASALAAGNPVIVKAHPAYPGTSELTGVIIAAAVESCGLPAGTFSLLFDANHQAGTALVQHPLVRAAAFTGSARAGRTLIDLAAHRPEPIPVYAEMDSSNPVFILPGALAERGDAIAQGLQASFALGGGQFATRPGLVFVEQTHAPVFSRSLRASGAAADASAAQAAWRETTGARFLATPRPAGDVLDPATELVHVETLAQMLEAARSLDGHLTATIFGTEEDLAAHGELLQILETKAGRLLFNAFPTGVEICHAMVHGGPYPATSDARSTSVGTQAIFRFARPVCYQCLPQAALPDELKDGNPLGIYRFWNGSWSHAKR